MGAFIFDWAKIHQKGSVGLWTPLLALFSFLYGIGVRLRLKAYRRNFLKKKFLPGFVVSIGNLTTGGTGKTPAVAMLAKWAKREGHRVAVLSRGYGGRYKSRVLVVSDGKGIRSDAREAGDEPFLLAKTLSDIPVVISKKRLLAGLYAHGKFGCDFFILDDGFQHLELERDLDLILIDSDNPFGNNHLLPRGPLREPVEQMVRADVSILTKAGLYGPVDSVVGFLKGQFPEVPFFCADHMPSAVVLPNLNEVHEPEFLKGKRVVAFAGIARPEVFKDTLIRLGADVVHFKGFRDHYQLKSDEIQELIKTKERLDGRYLLTTEKDWVRISSFKLLSPDLAYLRIKFALLSGQDDFFEIIKDGINRKKYLYDNHI
ncbi:MAG TPA: tetraacyldisaccharide 4'-kinase [Desulfobacteraceae bacterium]|nr:tetraacyldisaccharide 4'-kinase [Desulfobacteraceae bacterium]